MMFKTRFVELIPDEIQESVIYVSMEYGTVIHKCACGCGREVNTPLAPNEWHLHYNGDAISLFPSVGNWSFPCRSHYWIRKGKVKWASSWDDETIHATRVKEKFSREVYFRQLTTYEKVKNEPEVDSEITWLESLFVWIKKIRIPRE